MKKCLLFIKNQLTVTTALIFSFFALNTQAQVTVTAGGGTGAVTGGLGGPGLTISNVTINCPNNAYGQFANGASSGLGVNAGFMITTGSVTTFTGTNLNDDFSTCNNTSGSDPQLTALSSSATVDPCIIEFDVVPQCNTMSITFVFGSDEYTNWVNQSFNDAFGFFISGPNPGGGNYNNVNIATIPNGTAVSIDNVSHLTNTGFFVNNDAGTFSNSFDGFTTVLTPVINVTPCQSYHIKLAIADATDCAMDSGVLIDLIQCVSPWTVATSTNPSGCGVSTGTATATVTGGIGPFTYLWAPGGQTTSTATGLAAGNYTCTVNDGLSCTPSQVVNVTVGSSGAAPNTTITPAGPFCQTAAAVNLTAATGGGTWSGTGITNTTNGTFNPATAGPGSHTITYAIGGACPSSSTTTIVVNASTVPTFTAHPAICSGGTVTLPTTSTNGITGTWSPAVNNTATTPYTFTPTAGQCATTTTMTVTVNTPITPTFAAHPPICSGGTVTLPTTSTNGITGTWSPAVNNTATTPYTFTPTAGQCATTANMTVTVGAPTTPTFTAHPPICSGGTVTLPTTSTNGFTGTWSPAVNNTATTPYTFTPTAGQCATTASMTVTVGAPTTPTFAAHPPICSGGTVTLPTTSTNGFTGTWSPAVNNTATTPYTFTPTAGQCATTTTMTVTVNAIPTMTTPSNVSACPNDNVAASVFVSNPVGATFDWTNTNTAVGLGASGTGNTPAFTATNGTGASISGTVSITPTLNGCIGNPVTYIITVNDLFDPTITPAGPFCVNATAVNLSAVDGGGTWSGTGITNGATGTFDPATAGVGTHIISYTIAGSCGGTDTENILVNALPVVDPITDIAACNNDPIATSAFTSTPIGATFDWTNSNTSIGLGGSGTGNTPGFTATNGTGAAISGIVSVTPTLNGCIGLPVTYTITINNQFDATITPVGPFCESDASIIMNGVDAGGTWTGNGITNGTTGAFDPATAGPGTHTITYTIGGSCGDVQTTTITVNPDMDATITAAGPFCTNDPAIALIAVDGGGTWSGTGITNAALGIFDPSIALDGTHTITYTIAGACGDVQTVDIVVSSQLDATITPVANVCEQDASFNFDAVDVGGTWSGTGITDAVNGTFNPNTAGPGTHTITYTLGGSCGDVQTTTITVLPNMDAAITPAGPFCTGNTSTTLTAVDAGGVWSGNGITNAATGTFDPATAGVGTHLITYTIAGQCGDVQTIEIVVVSNFDATITPVGPFCQNASSVDLSTVNGGGTFTGTGITDAVNGIFNPATAGPGVHTITYTIPGACGDVQTTTITVNALPTVTFSVDNTSGCIPVTATFTDNTGLAGSTVTWSMSDGFISTTTGSVTHIFNSVGCFDVTLQVTSAQGCVSSATQNSIVCVSGIPVADFTWSPENASIMDPTVNFTNTSNGGTIFNWDFDGLGTSTLTNPSFVFPNTQPGTYPVCLAIENNAGCVDTVCHDIIIYDEFIVYVPNSFTPDNDGKNDIFLPIVNGHEPLSYQLLIFNRWGELIFETQHAEEGWDGTYKTIMSKEDTYVWKIKVKSAIDNKQHDFIGHVNLLK